MSNTEHKPPLRPYLMNAIHAWISECGNTPHMLVDCSKPGVEVPVHAIRDGRIVLNLSMRATRHLTINHLGVSFNARFNQVDRRIFVPLEAVVAIYARETGEGMALPPEQFEHQATANADAEVAAAVDSQTTQDAAENAALKPTVDNTAHGISVITGNPGAEPPTERRRGHLSIVK